MSNTEDKCIDDFDIDVELQSIADKITEHKLNFGGALFEKEGTKEEFVVTVTKANFMHDLRDDNDRLTEENAKLMEALSSVIESTKNSDNSIIANIDFLPFIKADLLVNQLKEQNNDK